MPQEATRIVYKVVRREIHNGNVQYKSAFTEGKAEVCYKVGEYVEAPAWLASQGYHLFVFDSLLDAIKALYPGAFELWEAEAQDVQEPKDLSGMRCDKLQEGILEPGGYSLSGPGVLMAKRVKLVMLVHPRP
jgi:hypothetical protein